MELWVIITLFAALFQTIRTALQKRLTSDLSTNGAAFTRFLYGFPWALLYLLALALFSGLPVPSANITFLLYMMLGGLAQIIATSLLIAVFSFHNFAVGTTFSKTEAVQVALFSAVILGEQVSAWGAFAIVISVAGVMLISQLRGRIRLRNLLLGWLEKPALLGILSGGLFGLAAVAIRGAALSLQQDNFLMPAAYTLAWITVFQTSVMALYLRWREPAQWRPILQSWRSSAWVGFTGVLGSACWFNAMTLQNAAYVRTVGQIELIFTLAISYFFFRERPGVAELIGIGLIVAGVIILLLLR